MRTCVSIIETNAEDALRASRLAVEKGADLLELRFDLMSPMPSSLNGFGSIHIPKIATLRNQAQGGHYNGSEKDRLVFFQSAIKAGFHLIDLEFGSPLWDRREKELKDAHLICSYHDFEKTPKPGVILELMIKASSRAAIPKVAFNVKAIADLLSIIDAARMFSSTEKEFVVIGMGELGEITRVCADRIGCAFAYASLEKGKEAAPGQVDLDTMRRLTPEKVITGIIGHPLSHSLSPSMHNAAFLALGIPGRYLAFSTRPEELEAFLQLAVEVDMRGFNVTIPHKESIMPFLDRLDASAEAVGAVNTVEMQDGDAVGHNTDLVGVQMTLKQHEVEAKGKKALVVGAGGAARAVCAALAISGARIAITTRNWQKAESLSKKFKGAHPVTAEDALREHFDLVINCTPLGMKGFPDELPISPAIFHQQQFVMDAVYNPPRTRFLIEAEKRGASTINGESMLVHQALKAFEIWTGKAPPAEVMLRALREGRA